MIEGEDPSPSPPGATVTELPFTAAMKRRGMRVSWERDEKHHAVMTVRLPYTHDVPLPPDVRGGRAYEAFLVFCRELIAAEDAER